jgi:hypothetical protein
MIEHLISPVGPAEIVVKATGKLTIDLLGAGVPEALRSAATHTVFPAAFSTQAAHSTNLTASSSFVRNFQPRHGGIDASVRCRTCSMARSGNASAPKAECRTASDSVTHTWP